MSVDSRKAYSYEALSFLETVFNFLTKYDER